MADTDTDTTPPPDPTAIDPALLQRLQQQLLNPQPVPLPQQPSPSSHEGRGWASLLGEALGGGQQYGTTAERESGGLAALMAAGARMSQASDYSQQRHTLGSILAAGTQGAAEALGQRQAVTAAQQSALLDYQRQQQEMQLARVKEAIPLLTLQQQMQRLKIAQGMPNPLAPGATPTSIGAAGSGGIGAVGADSATRKAAEGGPPAPDSPGAAVAQNVHDFWIGKGYTEAQVAGIMAGGPGSESNFNPTASGDGGTSYGLYQHHGPRLDAMRQYFGLTGNQMPTADQQNQYAAYEISPQGPYAKVGAALKDAKTPADAATIWTRDFGVPADKTEIPRRAGGADRFTGLYTPKATPGAPGTPAAAGGPPAASGVAQGDVAHPELAPGPPGSTGGAPIGVGAALAPSAVAVKGTPIPSGKLLKSDATPNVDASGQVIADTRTPQEIRLGGVQTAGPGAGPSLPPSPVATPVAAPQPGWGTGAATGYNVGTTGAAAPPAATPAATPQPVAVVTAQTPPPAPIPVAAKPDADLTFEEYRGRHGYQPTTQETAGWNVTPNPQRLQEAQASMLTAAQNLQLARGGMGDMNKASAEFETARNNVAKLEQDAQAASVTNRQTWFAKRDEMLAANYRAEKAAAAAAALKTQEGQQAIDLAKVNAGQTWHQKLQEQAATYAQDNVIKPMSASAAKAHQMNLGLSQMIPILQDLPKGGGALGAVLDAHPDLAPLFNTAGILTDKSADAVRLINGLVSNISTEMKPTGLGALREYEWDAFKAQLPNLLSTPVGQQKAVALLMNMNNRIADEHSWMSNYFSRKVPDETTPGKMVPAHNLESDNPKESVQQRMDRELGPIIPSYTGAATGSGQSQWEQSLPPGKPYYKTWAVPDPRNLGQPQRDQRGNVVTTKTLEVRPWQ